MNQRERWEFEQAAVAEGMDEYTARLILRDAATLHRLAGAVCNGDWPAEPPQVLDKVYRSWPAGRYETLACSRCTGLWARSVMLGREQLCPDCRATARIKARVAVLPGWSVTFNGDPRGAVVIVKTPAGRELVAG